MEHPLDSPRRLVLAGLRMLTLAASILVMGSATAAEARVDESQLLALGFKVLVATTSVQEEWVQRLPPGRIRPMQRNGKKYFIYPDAPAKRVFVGGPNEYEAYLELHPENTTGSQDAAAKERALRLKQDAVMRRANSRDLSDPFLGVTWGDLIW